MNRNSNLKLDQPIICEVVHVVRGGIYFDPLAKNVTFKFLTGNLIASLNVTNPPPLCVLKTHLDPFLITHWKWIKVVFRHVMRFSMGNLDQNDFLNKVMSKLPCFLSIPKLIKISNPLFTDRSLFDNQNCNDLFGLEKTGLVDGKT